MPYLPFLPFHHTVFYSHFTVLDVFDFPTLYLLKKFNIRQRWKTELGKK